MLFFPCPEFAGSLKTNENWTLADRLVMKEEEEEEEGEGRGNEADRL